MEHLIATYLLQNKSCALPGIGKLSLAEKLALVSPGAKLIEAPHQYITLQHGDFASNEFVNYISAVKRIDEEEARSQLQRFCNQLQTLDSFAETKIPNTGKFYVNAEGSLVFKQAAYPTIFLDTITAEKVIHPDANHLLLVGDKESNTTLMTEYYNVQEPAPQKKWWIAALLMALVGLSVICVYYFNEKSSGMFGNATKTPVQQAPQFYTTPK